MAKGGNGGGGGGGGGGAARYQLRFIVETDQGEITSGLFPAAGVQLNAKDPWKTMKVGGAHWTFNNHTNGKRGLGKCTVATDVDVNWDIAGSDPVRSFAGDWIGTVEFWRNKGMNFYMVGERPGNSAAVINNIASNHNETVETRAEDGASWFRIRFTNARLGFGGASSPDGEVTLSQLPGYESACANFTIEAVRMP